MTTLSFAKSFQPDNFSIAGNAARVIAGARNEVAENVEFEDSSLARQSTLERALDLVEQSTRVKCPTELDGFDGLKIYLYSQENRVLVETSSTNDQNWHRLLRAPKNKLRLKRALCAPELKADAANLDALRWQLTTSLSHGTLLPSIAGRRKFHLAHWPDLGALGCKASHVRIAALLVARECSVMEISYATGLHAEEVIAFLNGCYVVGCLSLETRLVQRTTAASAAFSEGTNTKFSGFTGMLHKLRAALSLTPRSSAV
jgi:hypothetical protein